MKSNKNSSLLVSKEPENQQKLLADRQSVLDLVTSKADNKAKKSFDHNLAREKETFELLNGRVTSIYLEKENFQKLLAEFPQDHEPKFTYFFPALGKLVGWTEEEMKSYHKPAIAAKTIIEVVYNRFPENVKSHINSKNPYIKWCVRKHKNYLFLGDDGILLLEKFIDDAVTLMGECTSMYDFRVKHAIRFGTTFQQELFQQFNYN